MAIEKIEQSGEFDVSILRTGIPKHYSILGWESLSMPTPVIMEWKNFDPTISNIKWRSASEVFSSDRELLLELHTSNPREYQFDRSPSTMFEHWIDWQWQQNNAIVHICHEVEAGYVMISKPDNVNDVYVSEWRAPNIDVERKLLKLAAEEIRRRQHQQTNVVRFHGLPQYMSVDELKRWGDAVQIQTNERTMIRNIRLPTETIEKIKTAYIEGSAAFWPADFF
ncbi:unnamed protein product [Rotaria sp. Silwood1]|nr:unnamed protein product [Rotaria sp. Silwood1]